MPSINWNLTLDTILDGKCILFLGPEVFTNAKGEQLDERLLKYLGAGNDPDVKVYDDGLFFFRAKQKRTETYLKIRRFFEAEQFPEAEVLFQKIARIPFHFIIKVTADNQLEAVYEKLQLKCKSDFYWKKTPVNQKAPLPTQQQPLIYKILGSIEKPESLVLTHDDLFDYLESIFQAQSMSDKLKDHIINEAQSIIFLGIPFDRWYMQLLLRVLHLHKDEEFMRFAATQELTEEVQTLCHDQFKINFVPNNIESFVSEIYSLCEQRGKLRQIGVRQQSIIQSLREMISEDELDDIFEKFMDWLEEIGERGEGLLNVANTLSGRYKRLAKKIAQGVVSQDDANLETNKIRAALLELINEAKTLE